MIAEIKGKVNRQNTNLTETREDELTGNFFGTLRYIPFCKGLKKILKNAVWPIELRDIIEEIDVQYWDKNIFFWEKIREKERVTELDVRMEFASVIIGIEVKYQSGLSSEDTGNDEISGENSLNQLSREARVLRAIGLSKKKLLLLLADDLACVKIIQGVKMIDGVQLGYLSWQEVLVQLRALTDLNNFEQLMISDLIELLEKKGFLRFSDFDIVMSDISKKGYWHFGLPEKINSFSFQFGIPVEDDYYEFR